MIFAKLYQEHISEEKLQEALKSNEQITYWAYILHNLDEFATGEIKKAHYHIIIEYIPTDKKGCKAFMSKIFTQEELSGCDIQSCKNVIKAHRYLLHLDNLEKHQYDKKDIVCSNLDLLEEYLIEQIKPNKREVQLEEILDYVEGLYDVLGECSYRDLIKHCREVGSLDYYISHKHSIDATITQLFGALCIEYGKNKLN